MCERAIGVCVIGSVGEGGSCERVDEKRSGAVAEGVFGVGDDNEPERGGKDVVERATERSPCAAYIGVRIEVKWYSGVGMIVDCEGSSEAVDKAHSVMRKVSIVDVRGQERRG